MHWLWLVGDCVISCYNHLMQGDYTRSTKFQNGSEEVINVIKENSIAKSSKNTTEFGGTLFSRKIWRFCWLNWMNLLKLLANLDIRNHCAFRKNHVQYFLYTYIIYNRIQKHLSNYTKRNFMPQAHLTLLNNTHHFIMRIIKQLYSISPSANNC